MSAGGVMGGQGIVRGLGLATLLLCAIGAMLALAPGAWATTITVNTNADGAPADDGSCMLREAIVASNTDTASGASGGECAAGSGADTIAFDGAQFDFATGGTEADSTITIDTSGTGDLPANGQQVAVDGCSATPDHAGPCVGLRPDVTGTATAIRVTASNSAVRGLAITHAFQGLFYGADNTGLELTNDWFGIRLGGGAEGNTVGATLAGDQATVGGTAGATGSSPADRNVFGNNAALFAGSTAVAITGSSNTVLGNYFGAAADGTTSAPNDTDIEVQGPNGTDAPQDNVIGGTVSTAAAATSACDDVCNVIASGTENAGVVLGGADGSGNVPPSDTTIAGNFVGLDVNGDPLPNAVGIDVGQSHGTTIGGDDPDDGDRNYIGGTVGDAGSGVNSGNDSTGLLMRGNYLSLTTDGTAAAPTGTSASARIRGTGPEIRDNRFGSSPDGPFVGLELLADMGVVAGNVFGVGTGGEDLGHPESAIEVFGNSNLIGGSAGSEANVIGFSDSSGDIAGGAPGITLQGGDGNPVDGNYIGTDASAADLGNEGPGVLVEGDSHDNVVGGTTAASENVISNNGEGGNGADAITIEDDPDNTSNRLLRNTGAGNADLFIDLGADGAGNNGATGPNHGVQAPTGLVASTTRYVGLAEPGAVVRAYDADGAQFGRIDAFLGQATTDSNGLWHVTYGAPVPLARHVDANQTSGLNSSETVGGIQAVDGADSTPPNTSITSGPPSPTSDKTPDFKFVANEGGARFLCRVDFEDWQSCDSGAFTTQPLANGPHTFHALAIDAAGNVDPTDAARTFTVDTSAAPPPGGGSADTRAPETEITEAPKKKVKSKKKKVKVTFGFSADEPGSSFECSLDGDPFEPCTSPDKEKVKKGKHTFGVRAKDAAGNVDSTPAEDGFKVRKKKKKKK